MLLKAVAAIGKRFAKPPRRWIVDTGAAIDIVGEQDFSGEDLRAKKKLLLPQTLDTAGGDIDVTHSLPMKSNAMEEDIEPLLCKQSRLLYRLVIAAS